MIVAYDHNKLGIYYSGPSNDAAYITRFVDTMKRPIKLLHSKLDLLKVHQDDMKIMITCVWIKCRVSIQCFV